MAGHDDESHHHHRGHRSVARHLQGAGADGAVRRRLALRDADDWHHAVWCCAVNTATRGELGARFDKAMLVQGGVFTLKAKTAWAHDWNTDRAATATFQNLPGATFTTNGAQPSAHALVSLGGEMKWHSGWTLAGSFDGEFSRTTANYAGKGTVKYAW